MSELRKLGIRQVMGSVAAAFFGVQSARNRERDFSKGRPRDFVIVGLLLTLVFVLTIWRLVQLVMSIAQ